ncbi:cell division protein PerM [Nocardioides salsibiostraticola]
MTSLLPSAVKTADRARRGGSTPPAPGGSTDSRPRPLTVVATLGGLRAAMIPLVICLVIGLIGWFSIDAGAHGTPRDGLRTGALGWLMGHGSGVRIDGVEVTMVPLGVTALAAFFIWRVALRVGQQLAAYGPDAGRIDDGERDWTVPAATLLFAIGYAVTAVLVATVAATPATDPSAERVLVWSILMAALLGGCAIAVGSGRAAIWTASLPETLGGALRACRHMLVVWIWLSLATFLIALLMDLSTAANVMSQLGVNAGDAIVLSALSLTVLPNAVAFSGAFLLGPGFTVGAATIVSPSLVVLGPLPMLPIFAALPQAGTPSGWLAVLLVTPVVVGAAGAVRAQRRSPTLNWTEGAVRGGTGGVLTGLAFAFFASLAGGAIGPGRMRDVAPLVGEVLVHAITTFGLGGLIGGLLVTWWQRRAATEIDAH